MNNYIANTHYLADKDGYLGRFDQKITESNKAYFRFAWNRYRTNPGRENILFHWYDIDNTTNSYGEPEPIDTLNLTFGDVDTISPTVMTSSIASWNRFSDSSICPASLRSASAKRNAAEAQHHVVSLDSQFSRRQGFRR